MSRNSITDPFSSVLHQTVIVVVAFYMVQLAVPGGVQRILLLIAATAGTFTLYEIVRRVGTAVLVWDAAAAETAGPAGFGARGDHGSQRRRGSERIAACLAGAQPGETWAAPRSRRSFAVNGLVRSRTT